VAVVCTIIAIILGSEMRISVLLKAVRRPT
jgi:hypothetical protein